MARKFAFFAPYITGPGAQELFARIRDAHVVGAQKLVAAGIIKLAGPFYTDNGAGEDAADRALGGSFLLLEAESHAEALKIIEADEFYKHGVWNVGAIRLVEYNPITPYPF
ncbi:hypothetical protein B0H19DRAFT_1276869 [Mycena capillaripes]|nr:hypothetical protein B0H19DRAFT_1276869 [Mycena capillaripes]